LKEKEEIDDGDQSHPTTSGITITVLILSAEIWVMVRVLEPTPETSTTEPPSIPKLDIEDVLLEIPLSFNAEDMVDQTKMTRVLKLMSNALEDHGYHTT
jgi:hypothetical protein